MGVRLGASGGGCLQPIETFQIPSLRRVVDISAVISGLITDVSISHLMPMRRQLGFRQRGGPDSAGNTGENNLTVQ